MQQIELVGQLKYPDNATADNESMFALTNFRKNQRNNVNIFSRKCNSIIKNIKLSRGESEADKYTIKQMKNCSKK